MESANKTIAPTHENESAKETLCTATGQLAATTIAAMASVFSEIARAPQAGAMLTQSQSSLLRAARGDASPSATRIRKRSEES